VHKRLIVVDVGGDQKKPLVLINPRVKEILEPE
jgi:peptide deformylase